MEELLDLKELLLKGDIQGSLAIVEEAYLNAIDEASLEVEEGRYEPEELEQLINKKEILNRALALILPPA
ncbi:MULTISPECIES: hypothetical protein [unclassified Coleofasciculus]|uniref:hypothetical protein n=1 Tax=Cyanophyceae TaxID=3028117 RepID=UPI001689280D|nr:MULTISPECIES: hypothetical protein [unclassified Coleofasciculus]MBD1877941.1 hypothetical protein [Coleofasciculus sp. FACHB-T130]MBD1900554.1 hypothetical protein [Coleofasciculus sp. FACHB-125]MBD2087176.1 hypothetical protein [Coleofasciculus sp. FACHB-542]